MIRKRRGDGNINELQLFHGTKSKFITGICHNNFDFRFSGKTTGSLYGEGKHVLSSISILWLLYFRHSST